MNKPRKQYCTPNQAMKIVFKNPKICNCFIFSELEVTWKHHHNFIFLQLIFDIICFKYYIQVSDIIHIRKIKQNLILLISDELKNLNMEDF